MLFGGRHKNKVWFLKSFIQEQLAWIWNEAIRMTVNIQLHRMAAMRQSSSLCEIQHERFLKILLFDSLAMMSFDWDCQRGLIISHYSIREMICFILRGDANSLDCTSRYVWPNLLSFQEMSHCLDHLFYFIFCSDLRVQIQDTVQVLYGGSELNSLHNKQQFSRSWF